MIGRKKKPTLKESPRRKHVVYGEETYLITTEDFGYTTQEIRVNGHGSSIHMPNDFLYNADQWKKYATQAIEEYINRKIAREEFENWDGKL